MAKTSNLDKLKNFFEEEKAFDKVVQGTYVPGMNQEDRKAAFKLLADEGKKRGEAEAARSDKGTRVILRDKADNRHYRASQSVLDNKGDFIVYLRENTLKVAQDLSAHIAEGKKLADFRVRDAEGKPAVGEDGKNVKVPSAAKFVAFNANAITTVGGVDRPNAETGIISDLEVKKSEDQKRQGSLRLGMSIDKILENAAQQTPKGQEAMLSTLREVSDYTQSTRTEISVSRANQRIAEKAAAKSKEAGGQEM